MRCSRCGCEDNHDTLKAEIENLKDEIALCTELYNQAKSNAEHNKKAGESWREKYEQSVRDVADMYFNGHIK